MAGKTKPKKEIKPSGDDVAAYLFHEGTNYQAYRYLGAHREGTRYVFRVWAPNAEKVFLVGDFNQWQDTLEMQPDNGVYSFTAEDGYVRNGDCYKYHIWNHGRDYYKADPYAFYAEKAPNTASRIYEADPFVWTDEGWLKRRQNEIPRGGFYRCPMNIYEMHLGSWKKKPDGSDYGYRELADELAPYVKQMGYTHVELLPVMEHPFGGSWGYQVTGYYAPTSRYGTPDDFKAFVDILHTAGIGVILDWVPAHFPKDAHGLYEFDGQPLYEYQGSDRMESAGWGTRRFDVGRQEVQSFLISNVDYWAREFHVDGIRVDAVASMLYLDYDRKPGEWVPNVYGDNRCLEAIAFFQKLNSYMFNNHPDVLMIAEESSSWPLVTSFWDGGLGFNLKWNMGWMNDSLTYHGLDPIYRKYHHDKMTFSLTYAFSEKYVLPISHDEVVHGKKSLLDKVTGDYWQKFAGERVFLGYMMTHPGKKLLFMGSEIGQFREWDYAGSIEWFLLDYDSHAQLQRYVAELNRFYLAHSELWSKDDSFDGFQWTDADNSTQSILSYRRIGEDGKELIVLLNFTPNTYEVFRTGVPFAGIYEEVLNSDDVRFGGSGVVNTGTYTSAKIPVGQCQNSIEIRVPPLGMTVLRCKKKEPEPVSAKISDKTPVPRTLGGRKRAKSAEKKKEC